MMTYVHVGILLLAFISTGCATSSGDSPASNRAVPFTHLKDSPDSFRGQTVVLGGEVLAAKRLKEGTRIEVLQLPLEGGSEVPVADLGQSQGRFLAMQREFLDPATLPNGTRLTVTGVVADSRTMPLDETDYTYPVIEVRNIRVWPQTAQAPLYGPRPYPYPYYYPYWGPMWGPFWRPYPYW
jgi:outer membrane lipoprotein